MKLLAQIVAVAGLMFLTSGCTTSSQSTLASLNGNVCKNTKCQCPKPCQCGAACRCGLDGNSNNINGK